MGSTRLPGKILKKFYKEKTLIEILLENLHKIEYAKVIIATSVNKDNDYLEKFLLDKGEIVYRGSENDVLERFIKAAETYDVDSIIRICSDNPFMDWQGIERLVEKAKNSEADYIGFRINDTPSIKTHFGFWGEYVTLEALKRVAVSTVKETPAHEHVTIHIYTNPHEYKCEWIECPGFLQGRNDIRLTIDTMDDFLNAQKVFRDLKLKNENFSLPDIISYIDENENLRKSMLNIIDNNKK